MPSLNLRNAAQTIALLAGLLVAATPARADLVSNFNSLIDNVSYSADQGSTLYFGSANSFSIAGLSAGSLQSVAVGGEHYKKLSNLPFGQAVSLQMTTPPNTILKWARSNAGMATSYGEFIFGNYTLLFEVPFSDPQGFVGTAAAQFTETANVPEPASIAVLGAGVLGLAAVRKKWRRNGGTAV